MHTKVAPPIAEEGSVWDELWAATDWRPRDEGLVERERNGRRWALIRESLRGVFGRISGLSTLELGCGRGDVSLLLRLEGADVTLLDRSPTALETAAERFEKWAAPATVVAGDLLELPRETEAGFDVVLSIGVAEHFTGPARARAIESHARSLKKGGVAIISVPYAYCPTYRLWKAYLEARGWWPYGLERPFSRRELGRLAAMSGLRPLRVETLGFWQALSDQWGRSLLHWDGAWEDKPSRLDRWVGATLVYVGQRCLGAMG